MVVGIDLRCLPADGSAGAGVAHAARFLTEALLFLDVSWEWRLYIPSGADQNSFSFPLTKGEKKGVSVVLPDASGTTLRRALREHPCDILFVPGGSVAPFLSVPTIPWVHDVAIFDHPEWFPQSWFQRFKTTMMFRRGIKKAPVVFAVSEETKRQIVKKFHIAPQKIVVTLEGGDPYLSVIPAKAGTHPRPFVLFLGTIEPRKNHSMLLNAWRIVFSSLPKKMELVIAGASGWKCEGCLREIEKTPHVRRIENVTDEKRRELLRSADLVVVPSLYEGFGLVALEAMQAGTALIASNAGSLPEVVGDGGVLIDPNDVNAWAEAMRSLLVDDAKRQRLAEKGRTRAKDFSWEKTAAIVVNQMKKRS